MSLLVSWARLKYSGRVLGVRISGLGKVGDLTVELIKTRASDS